MFFCEANSLVGNFYEEPTSTPTASTDGDPGAVESIKKPILSLSDSKTTKPDEYEFRKQKRKQQLLSGRNELTTQIKN